MRFLHFLLYPKPHSFLIFPKERFWYHIVFLKITWQLGHSHDKYSKKGNEWTSELEVNSETVEWSISSYKAIKYKCTYMQLSPCLHYTKKYIGPLPLTQQAKQSKKKVKAKEKKKKREITCVPTTYPRQVVRGLWMILSHKRTVEKKNTREKRLTKRNSAWSGIYIRIWTKANKRKRKAVVAVILHCIYISYYSRPHKRLKANLYI